MKQPDNVVVGSQKDHHINPRLLELSNLRYHIHACSIKHEGQPIVMWTEGSQSIDGSVAGEHDGFRSSSHSGRTTSMSLNFIRYCSLKDWTEAGNSIPA